MSESLVFIKNVGNEPMLSTSYDLKNDPTPIGDDAIHVVRVVQSAMVENASISVLVHSLYARILSGYINKEAKCKTCKKFYTYVGKRPVCETCKE